MEAIYGLALMSASVLALFFAARLRNAPNASTWIKSGVVLQTVLFSTVVGFIFGVSLIIGFSTHMSDSGFGFVEIGLVAVIAAASWIGWLAIQKMPAPQSGITIGPADNLPPAANNHGPQLRTGRKKVRLPGKAA
jgi:hypothetical protein